MANVGGDDNPATWGAEALRINVVLHRLFPIPWSNYCFAKEKVEADSDLQHKYIVYGSDADRRLVALQRATNELEVALCSLLEDRGSERWELWGRLNRDWNHDKSFVRSSRKLHCESNSDRQRGPSRLILDDSSRD